MKAVVISSLIMGTGIAGVNGVYLDKIVGKVNEVNYTSTDLPQIPFEVENGQLQKTILVAGGCERRTDSVTVKFNQSDANIAKTVFTAVDKAFNKPGIRRVQVCRVTNIKDI